jgi:hypothetical protein
VGWEGENPAVGGSGRQEGPPREQVGRHGPRPGVTVVEADRFGIVRFSK